MPRKQSAPRKRCGVRALLLPPRHRHSPPRRGGTTHRSTKPVVQVQFLARRPTHLRPDGIRSESPKLAIRVRLPARVPSSESLTSKLSTPLCSVGEEPPREPHKLETLVRLQPLHPLLRLRSNPGRPSPSLLRRTWTPSTSVSSTTRHVIARASLSLFPSSRRPRTLGSQSSNTGSNPVGNASHRRPHHAAAPEHARPAHARRPRSERRTP